MCSDSFNFFKFRLKWGYQHNCYPPLSGIQSHSGASVDLAIFGLRAVYGSFSCCFVTRLVIDSYLSMTSFEGIYIVYMEAYVLWSCLGWKHFILAVDPQYKNGEKVKNSIKLTPTAGEYGQIRKIEGKLNKKKWGIGDKNKEIQKKDTVFTKTVRLLIEWRNNLSSTLICLRPQARINIDRENKLNRASVLKKTPLAKQEGCWRQNFIATCLIFNKGRLDPLNRGMVSHRGFQTSSCSLICGRDVKQSIYPKDESFSESPGEKDLEQLAKRLLEKNIWPMEDTNFRLKANKYIFDKLKEISIESANIFVSCRKHRSITMQSEKWLKLMEKSGFYLSSLVWRIAAIELLSLNPDSTCPGVDGRSFEPVLAKVDSVEQAKRMLQGKIFKLKAKINLSKGKTDQAIKRKGKKKLIERELLRRHLKSPKGKFFLHDLKEQYSKMVSDPVEYILNERLKNLEHNKKLKFLLLKEIKYYKLINFSPEPVKNIEIFRSGSLASLSKGDVQIKSILSIRDRAVFTLLNLIMESYMEPLGDPHSFGFRLGRDTQQAVSVIANRIDRCGNRNQKSFFPNLTDKVEPNKSLQKHDVYNSQHIINVVANDVLENISHKWLVNNVPMPKGFDNLLTAIYHEAPPTPRLEFDPQFSPVAGGSNKSVSTNQEIYPALALPLILASHSYAQGGGILSTLLVNWILDGLEDVLMKIGGVGKAYPVWVVRYVNKFVIGVDNYKLVDPVMQALESFLGKRGLTMHIVQRQIIPWITGGKFDFLDWTFHLIKPKRPNWMVRAPRSRCFATRRLSDWLGVYVYPSRKATQKLRDDIRRITSLQETNKEVGEIVKELDQLLRGWSNYFIGGKQYALRAHLDHYCNKRTLMFLWKKYGNSYGSKIIEHHKINGMWTTLYTKNQGDKHSPFGSPAGIRSVPALRKMTWDIPLNILKPEKKLIDNSIRINPSVYLKRKLLLESFLRR